MTAAITNPADSNTAGCIDCQSALQPSISPISAAAFSFKGFASHLMGQLETRLGLMGAGLFLLSFVLERFPIWPGIPFVVQLSGLVIAGFPLARSGFITLVTHHEFNVNLLMTIAALGAIAIGDTEEGVTLILLFILAEALESYTTQGASSVLSELSQLAPEGAIRLTGDREEWVAIEQLNPLDQLLIKPGERIPMDGEVISGSSEVNQAPITGESIPVYKDAGQPLFAGTINGSGLLKMTVTGRAAENTLARVIQMILEAQKIRSPRARMIDTFARVYTPFMAAAAVLVAAIPPLFWGQPFLDTPDGSHGWLYRSLAFLVISCPCALVLSTPVAALNGIARAARQGILIKGGAYLEGLASIKAFAFDKTGTLTRGEPEVARTRSIKCEGDASCEHCEDVLAMASALERRSTHPLARAVVNEAEARGIIDHYPPAEEVIVTAGLGITGNLNGKPLVIGSHAHFDTHFSHSQDFCTEVSEMENNGHTTMLLYHESHVSGYIAVADQPRAESSAVIAGLKKMGKTAIMLTGDNKNTAQSVGRQLGIDQIHANLLPAHKVDLIASLKERYGQVAMIGDGINDAPAMASADMGIAMGGAASAQAMETANIVLMASNLNQLPFSIQLSAFTRRIIQQNLSASLFIKLVFVVLALAGLAPLWLAVIADSGMALVVVLNSLRPLKFRETPLLMSAN